jgi:flagellar motor switch protein FliN
MPQQAVIDQTETQLDDSKIPVQSAQFPQASASAGNGPKTSIDILLDMNVPVTVVIGKTEVSIQQLLQLCPGSVLELSKSIDEPADLYLKDTKFATGSIVVVEDKFAIRIKEIIGTLADTASKN